MAEADIEAVKGRPECALEITADQARALLRYEPETGRLFWLKRPREMFASDGKWKAWNTRYAGAEAFTSCNGEGYRHGKIHDRNYRAHRVIMLLQTGAWPTEQVDHANGVRTDNRWSNLRAVSNAENNCNQGRRSNNTSGVCGVTWRKREGRWCAQLKIKGRYKHLGNFATFEDAVAARAAANAEYGFSDRHGGKS